ncbi:MAG: hypothetical protein ACRENE_23280 [Polyangiaceae bacterium]
MMTRTLSARSALPVCLLLGGVACSGTPDRSSPGGAAPGASSHDAGAPAGYVRYSASTVTVAPGTSPQFFEWVAPPAATDADVVDIVGWQSKGGHHALLYATTDVQPVGTVKPWSNDELLQGHILGGVGGEAGTAIALPQGAVFRLHKGQALAIQTHYLNPGSEPLDVSSWLDVKMGEPTASDVVASTFGNSTLTLSVPAQSTMYQEQLKCTVGQDMRLLMFTNHMHQWGTSASTVLTDSTGTPRDLKVDPVWNPEWTTNADYTKLTVAAPQVIHAGDILTTTCTYDNTTDGALTVPAEMCAFAAFFIGPSDLTCLDGKWQ